MFSVQRLPIKTKLVIVITLVASIIAAGEILLFSFHDAKSYRELKRTRTSMIAEFASFNASSAITFDDREDATKLLQAFNVDDSIKAAYLFTADGNLFAHYLRRGESMNPSLLPQEKLYDEFRDQHYHLFYPIIMDGHQIGGLYLISDLKALRDRKNTMILIASIAALAGIIISLLLALWLQMIFTVPIRKLKESIQTITSSNDYSVRALKASDDEFGNLVEGFNHMLGEIQLRDKQLAAQMVQLEENNRELDQRVTQRTSQLEAANKELEGFSYSVSHDLRAPLRSIEGFSNILLADFKDSLNSEAQRLLTIICDDVHKMGCLIDDLLAFSRMSRQQMAKSRIDMNELTKQVFHDLQSRENHREVTFRVNNLPPLIGDLGMIRQVLINLISNALKFTSKRETAVIEVEGKTANGCNIYSVKDNGVGFDNRFQNKLFGVFQRLHSEEEFKGTGVGLALVQRIVERHGGKVQAESEIDHGAVFSLTIPMNEQGERI